MRLFKTKAEKKIEQEMIRDEQMQIFNSQISELKKKREEYAKIAAEAEINNDTGTFDVAANNLLELNDVISSLMQTKANFDIINVSNSIASNMAMAVGALSSMASGSAKLPDLRKIQKVNVKVANYMKQIKISNKAVGSMMGRVNPANRQRSDSELASIRPLIDAARSKLTVSSTPTSESKTTENFDLSSEIQAEKDKLI